MDKPNLREFLVKMAKMTLMNKVNDPHFQHQVMLWRDACLVQIWWFPKSLTTYRADKPPREFQVTMAKKTFKVKVNDP